MNARDPLSAVRLLAQSPPWPSSGRTPNSRCATTPRARCARTRPARRGRLHLLRHFRLPAL